ncbi:MAG: class I SAM-dependent methyltransferase [Acidobacteria bacterium]|nr:class I SAM-dependent methyltransferase [Acidobacteriota bacterium]
MAPVYHFKDFAGSSHRILIDMIRRSGVRGRFLDLGAAGGEIGDTVRSQFERTFAFEFDARRIPEIRRRFDHGVIADLERVHVLPKRCDAVLLADVIEHLRDPAILLRQVREALSPGGMVFLSVPNIANLTIRVGLLFGYFIYRDRGILDSTHLRFYTFDSLRAEIETAGFEIRELRGSSVPIRLIFGDYVPLWLIELGEAILAPITQLWKALLAYQLIIVATPKRED